MSNKDTTQIADEVVKMHIEYDADAVFIDYSGGLGAGVRDELRNRGYYATEVHFNGAARSDMFKNCRAEMWYEMGQWMKACELPSIDGLKTELTAPKYFYSANDHKLQLESKDEMRGRGLASPDIADAIALTFYAPVLAKPRWGNLPVGAALTTSDKWDVFGENRD
jgi:hypothetical protein